MKNYDHHGDLYKAVSLIRNREEAKAFLFDLLTPNELEELSARFQIAYRLNQKGHDSYTEISKKLKVSTSTVTRVARFLSAEKSGYKTILKRFKND